jgi:mono/diheme cytochrome c family protein
VRPVLVITAAVVTAILLGACGSEGVSVSKEDPAYRGAELFSERCAGCHTLTAAGTQGSANRAVRVQGPNLDQRVETFNDVIFAIRNGGFSGAIMPQNIVTGHEADAVARFVSKYAGSTAQTTVQPPGSGSP